MCKFLWTACEHELVIPILQGLGWSNSTYLTMHVMLWGIKWYTSINRIVVGIIYLYIHTHSSKFVRFHDIPMNLVCIFKYICHKYTYYCYKIPPKKSIYAQCNQNCSEITWSFNFHRHRARLTLVVFAVLARQLMSKGLEDATGRLGRWPGHRWENCEKHGRVMGKPWETYGKLMETLDMMEMN